MDYWRPRCAQVLKLNVMESTLSNGWTRNPYTTTPWHSRNGLKYCYYIIIIIIIDVASWKQFQFRSPRPLKPCHGPTRTPSEVRIPLLPCATRSSIEQFATPESYDDALSLLAIDWTRNRNEVALPPLDLE